MIRISTPLDDRDYPHQMKVWSVILCCLSCAAFLVTVYLSCLAGAAGLHQLGRLKVSPSFTAAHCLAWSCVAA